MLSTLGVIAVATPSASLPPDGQNAIVEELDLAASAPLTLKNEIFLREERVVRGDTFDQLLSRLGIQDDAARRYILHSPDLGILHRQLVPGRVVSARTTENGALLSLHFPMNGGETVTVVEQRPNGLTTSVMPRQYETREELKSGEIVYSLFGATDDAGIPDVIAVQMAEIFSGEIDFHRDLRKGDKFTLVYEMQYYRGYPVNTGRILAAEFVNAGRTYRAFHHADGGKGAYYDASGKSLKKAFLRSPLEFSRVTSGFSMRFHPILKTWRAHKGIDYGAPAGTRIRATGDGVVQFAGRQNGYGNFILLSHAGGYQTAYAHMSRFAEGIRKGDRVSQGDIIGYVGQTGWATGPHLHYEFRVRGQAINPLSLDVPVSVPLPPQQRAAFEAETGQRLGMLQLLRGTTPVRFE
ncbi:MAG: M23 family metallopeptidase [Zoogloeaceae bacterium]|nr:M23 family metallopeptidase [Zoogloeaceae bacterium]